jgi:hypothetical protein
MKPGESSEVSRLKATLPQQWYEAATLKVGSQNFAMLSADEL